MLTGWVRRRKTSQALALRARIMLLCAEGATIAEVAEPAGTSRNTVSKWRSLRHPRFHLHFTPTSSSWLNLVERWFAELTNRELRRSAHRSVVELERDVRGWVNEWNTDPKPFVWTRTADEILETLAALPTN